MDYLYDIISEPLVVMSDIILCYIMTVKDI